MVIEKATEIDKLNKLFYLNAYYNIFFHQKTGKDYITKIHYKNKKNATIRNLGKEIGKIRAINKYTGEEEEIYHYSGNKIEVKIDFSWLNMTKYAKSVTLPGHLGGLERPDAKLIKDILET